MTTAERIIKLFDESGMEYKEIADKLGVKPQKISEWKNGTTKSYRKYIDEIAALMGVSTDYLLTGSDAKKPPVTMLREQLDSICSDLPEDKQKQLIDYAKFLLSQPENEE